VKSLTFEQSMFDGLGKKNSEIPNQRRTVKPKENLNCITERSSLGFDRIFFTAESAEDTEEEQSENY